MSADSLRYASLSLSGQTEFPLFGESQAVSLESTRYVGPVQNGEYVGVSEFRGDLAVARELLSESDRVLQFNIVGTDEHAILYGHYETVGSIERLLTILYEHDIVIEWPIDHRRKHGERVIEFTVIGRSAGIKRAAAEIPDMIGLSVLKVGRLESKDGTDALLTDAQSDLLERAVSEGYYEVPRETTHRALADELGLTAATISDRLQRIERRIIVDYADDFASGRR
ncbi:helix-turn-helix domain-containing protein [Haloarcula nitratireducens]|uniref:Helix-turn-helix domain-containing protein n=1 Tax=Haloarcula nitratireducens TaxID=2487749 RepID=A0AAW4PI94_9EURY|nr:helix-turn-helix domain-containing protein [Halomicroarcula nitratireducens]MBX0297005.1 helix-turn-helix domain-containing protein [Halomicroarcula nitratireducens]